MKIFPGATGFGTNTPAGRGGTIRKITNLNDSGPGSLSGEIQNNSTILFEVGGVINLENNLSISGNNITIAGESAPYPGITLTGKGVRISGQDIFIRHIRVRPGLSRGNPGDSVGHSKGAERVIWDHCSISWSTDEVMAWFGVSNTSADGGVGPKDCSALQCIISEGLNNTKHSAGPFIGNWVGPISLIGCIMAHNKFRNPGFKNGSSGIVSNCLIYGAAKASPLGYSSFNGNSPVKLSYVGNVFRKSPETTATYWHYIGNDTSMAGSEIHQNDNILDGIDFIKSSGTKYLTNIAPIWINDLVPLPSVDVYNSTLSQAGARPTEDNPTDDRLKNQIIKGIGSSISTIELNEINSIQSSSRPLDGLLPNNPLTIRSDGYTNLEHWLHEEALKLEGIQITTQPPKEIDMSDFPGLDALLSKVSALSNRISIIEANMNNDSLDLKELQLTFSDDSTKKLVST